MSDKVIVVTGAANTGYGEAITRLLISKDYKVYGTYETDNVGEAQKLSTEFAESDCLHLVEVDHMSRTSLQDFIQSLPYKIDGFVNAQFFFEMENLEDFDHELWDKSIAINLTAPNFLIHSLRNRFEVGAAIVIVTSTEGFIGSFGASAYAASKAAIHNLIKTFANTLGEKAIRVNALAAGWIGGVMDTDEVFNMSRNITPLGRLGTAEEIASAAYFLLSPGASFINGSVLTADGGYSGVDTIAKYEFEQTIAEN